MTTQEDDELVRELDAAASQTATIVILATAGWRNWEIAKILGVTPSTVSAALCNERRRARKRAA